MSTMDFFRRPQLAGRALQRLPSGTVRGNLRRSDPDVSSAVPFFPGIAEGDTLDLEIDGTPYVVTFSSGAPSYQTILADINATLSPDGQAIDADGTVQIVALTAGGKVEITGGSAVAELGFDLSRSLFVSKGGDLQSTPEGRIGNPFGSSFPLRGEGLSVESVNRGFGRLAANLDVLYADHMRQESRLSKIAAGSTSVSLPASSTSLISLPVGTRVFTGFGSLSTTPTPEELAPYFQLIDPSTGLPPATCRVVGLVRGSVSGAAPYAPASLFSGAGSVAGIDLVKVQANISAIKDGRVVYVPSGTDFTTNGTQVGDWVKISGATNSAPWSNNGYRWVVEEILGATSIALRPMSYSEFVQANPSVTSDDTQPLIELNEAIGGTDVYGTIEVHTGPFMPDVRLVVQPPLPSGASYDVWVAGPKSLRESNSSTIFALPTFSAAVSQKDPLPNALLSGFQISGSGAAKTIGEGLARVHGKILRIPATVYTPGGFGNVDGTYFAFFDTTTGTVRTSSTTLPTGSVAADPTGVITSPVLLPLARFVLAGGSFVGSSEAMARFDTSVRSLTVGQGGELANLSDAALFINAWAAAKSETGIDSAAAYPHFEIVVLSSHNCLDALTFRCASLSIRGVNPLIKVGLVGSTPIRLIDCYSFTFTDLVFDTPSSLVPLVIADTTTDSNDGLSLRLQRIRHASGDSSTVLVKTANGGKLRRLDVDSCDLSFSTGIVAAAPAGNGLDIVLRGSRFSYAGDGSSTQMLAPEAGEGGSLVTSSIRVDDNVFTGWFTSNLTGKLFCADGGSGKIDCEDNLFTFGTFPSGSNAVLWGNDPATHFTFSKNRFTNAIPRVNQLGSLSEVCDNILFVSPHDTVAGTEAVAGNRVHSNVIIGSTPPSSVRGVLVGAAVSVFGNILSGEATFGIRGQGDVSGNDIQLSASTQGIRAHGVYATGAGVRIRGNNVSFSVGLNGYTTFASCVGSDVADTLVEGNYLQASGCLCFSALTTSAVGVLSGNAMTMANTGGTSRAMVRLSTRWTVQGNRFTSSGANYVALSTDNSAGRYLVKNNVFALPSVFATIANWNANFLHFSGNEVTGSFDSTNTTTYNGIFLDNLILGFARVGGTSRFIGNFVTSAFFVFTGFDTVTISNNTFTNAALSPLFSAGAEVIFESNSVFSDIVFSDTLSYNAKIIDNKFTGSVIAPKQGLMRGNRVGGLFSGSALVGSADLRLEGNTFVGAASFDATSVVDNLFMAACTITTQAFSASFSVQSVFESNRFLNNLSITCPGILSLKGCIVEGTLSVVTTSDSITKIDDNTVLGATTLALNGKQTLLSNNFFGSTMALSGAAASIGSLTVGLRFSNCTFIGAATYADGGAVFISGCAFGGGLTSAAIAARFRISDSDFASLTIGSAQVNRISNSTCNLFSNTGGGSWRVRDCEFISSYTQVGGVVRAHRTDFSGTISLTSAFQVDLVECFLSTFTMTNCTTVIVRDSLMPGVGSITGGTSVNLWRNTIPNANRLTLDASDNVTFEKNTVTVSTFPFADYAGLGVLFGATGPVSRTVDFYIRDNIWSIPTRPFGNAGRASYCFGVNAADKVVIEGNTLEINADVSNANARTPNGGMLIGDDPDKVVTAEIIYEIRQLSLNGNIINLNPIDTTFLTAHAATVSAAGVAIRCEARVGLGTVNGNTIEFPDTQVIDGFSLPYYAWYGMGTSVGAPQFLGVVLAGNSIVRTTYNATGSTPSSRSYPHWYPGYGTHNTSDTTVPRGANTTFQKTGSFEPSIPDAAPFG